MTATNTRKPAVKPAAKAVAKRTPAPARVSDREQEPLSPDELIAIGQVTGETGAAGSGGQTAADGTPITTVLTIVFEGRVCPVTVPDTGQIALLVDAERWMIRAQRDRQQLGDLEGLPEEHPSVVKAQKLAARGIEHVGRLARIIGSLFVDEHDWDWICDMLAGREIKWHQVAEIPSSVLRAYNESQGPNNREQRRAEERGKGRRAR